MCRPSRREADLGVACAVILVVLHAASAIAGQVRASLAVTVRVIAACGGSTDGGAPAAGGAGCPAGSAPLAVLSEGPAPDAGTAPTTSIEDAGDVRYLTLIY